MPGLLAIYKKELSDHFSSNRFVILFALIAMFSFIISYMAAMHLKANLEAVEGGVPKFVFLTLFTTRGALFTMVQFVSILGPFIGLVLGFDAINRERADGTLIKLVSQPIYRDAVINGKFLAGATTIAIMIVSIVLVISGFGLSLLGVVPGIDEVWRLIFYVIISIFYVSFWLGVAILFSIFFRSIATSALASFALWIFLSFVISLGASVLADNFAPVNQQEEASAEAILKNVRIKEGVSLFSPMVLYEKASATIINPMTKTTRAFIPGPLEQFSAARFRNPLSLGQSLIVVYPYIVALVAISLICFAISYTVFMMQEIRT
jgi:ABC-2 type transport system permease protein